MHSNGKTRPGGFNGLFETEVLVLIVIYAIHFAVAPPLSRRVAEIVALPAWILAFFPMAACFVLAGFWFVISRYRGVPKAAGALYLGVLAMMRL